jgi:hypothetical protein
MLLMGITENLEEKTLPSLLQWHGKLPTAMLQSILYMKMGF